MTDTLAPAIEQVMFEGLVEPRARRSDPETAHQAAAIATPNARNGRAIALEILRAHPEGLSDFELAALSGVQQTSIGKRRGELEKDGKVAKVPGKKRPSPSGAPAQVYKAIV